MAIYWRNGWAWARAQRNSKEYRAPLRTKDPEIAERKYASWLKDLDTPKDALETVHTVQEAIDKFTDEHLPNLKPKAVKRYCTSAKWIAPHFGDMKLAEVGFKELYSFEQKRRKMRYRGKRISFITIKRDLAYLSSIFSEAETWEWTRYNPVKAYIRSRTKKGLMTENDGRERYLSHEEEAALLAAQPKDMEPEVLAMLLDMVKFAIDTGLRADEQWELMKNEHFNWSRKRVFVDATFAKSGRSRWVPMFPRAAAIAERLRMSNRSDFLFWRYEGEQVEHTYAYRLLQKLADAAGIKDLEWHDLRRTCGCRLLQDYKMDMARVSRWLGHSSIKVTEKHYAFLRIDDLEEAAGLGGANGTVA